MSNITRRFLTIIISSALLAPYSSAFAYEVALPNSLSSTGTTDVATFAAQTAYLQSQSNKPIAQLALQNDFTNALNGSVIPNTGEKMDWSGGTLERLQNGNIKFSNGSYTQELKDVSDISILAKNNSQVNSNWINAYGIDVNKKPEDYKSFNDNFYNLTNKPASANSSSEFGFNGSGNGSLKVNYDQNGQAKSVTVSNGETLSIEEFKRSNLYSALSGNFAEKNNVYDPTKSNQNFKGFSDQMISSNEADNLNFQLVSLIWGVTEPGEKTCKPTDTNHTKPLVTWWSVAKNYMKDEKTRDQILQSRVELIKTLMNALLSAKSEAMQIEAIKLQIESVNAYIDSVSGEGVFSLDENKDAAMKTARIPSRENLLLGLMEANNENTKNNLENIEKYNALIDGITKSRTIAADACKRTKKVQECITTDGIETCNEKIEPDPVPGSCEMAEKYLTVYERGPVKDYSTLYLMKAVPSKKLNEKLNRLEDIQAQMISYLPVSNDKKWDWTTPLITPQKEMKKSRKKFGIMCPTLAGAEDYDYKTVDTIATEGNDPLMEMGKYALGVNLDRVEYEFANRHFENAKNEKGLSQTDAIKATWDMMVMSERGKYYIEKNAPLTPDKFSKSLSDFHNSLSKEYNVTPNLCTKELCNTYKGDKRIEANSNVPDAENLSKNAKDFLSAYGINGDSAELAQELFTENWTQADLIIGQPVNRSAYFSYAQNIVESMNNFDKAKLKELNNQKDKLVAFQKKLEETMHRINSGGGGSDRPIYSKGTGLAKNGVKLDGSDYSSREHTLDSADASLGVKNALPSYAHAFQSVSSVTASIPSLSTLSTGKGFLSQNNFASSNGGGFGNNYSFSSANQAIANKIKDSTNSASNKIKRYVSSSKKSLADSTDNTKNAFTEKSNTMFKKFYENPKSYEVTKSLAADKFLKNESQNASSGDSSDKTSVRKTTLSQSGPSYDSSYGYGSDYSGQSASTSNRNNENPNTNYSYQIPKTHEYSYRTPSSQVNIPLFNQISEAYQNIGRKKLELDE